MPAPVSSRAFEQTLEPTVADEAVVVEEDDVLGVHRAEHRVARLVRRQRAVAAEQRRVVLRGKGVEPSLRLLGIAPIDDHEPVRHTRAADQGLQ